MQKGKTPEGKTLKGIIQTGITLIGITQTGITLIGITQTGITKRGITQVGKTQVGKTQTGITQTGITQVGITQRGIALIGITQTGITKRGITQVGKTQGGITQTGITQTGITQVGITQRGIAQPLRGGTYLPLPANLAKKKAIINVQNRDNECLKWALRAALFPPRYGKNLQRPSKYPVNDGINYRGIDFPTPVKQIDKLERQNSNLAINVFGWEDNRVIVHRISKKEKTIPRINLILIESGLIQHYCFVKRVSALLFDQTKNATKKHFCMLCLTGFTRADLLENHEKYCNGMNGRPTRIEMPEEGKNTLSFQNHHKQMRAPYVIYADFEALVRKISGCEIGPESKQKSYTEKTEQHEACGFAYTVVRSDGRNKRPVVYRGENAVEVFLNCLQEEEKIIRNSLSLPKPLVMTSEDWVKFKNATDCHICEKSLIKDYFLDSLPVWESEEGSVYTYDGQWHKKCFYDVKKENDSSLYSSFLMLKRLTEEEHKEAAEEQDDCLCCGQPLLRQNFRDAEFNRVSDKFVLISSCFVDDSLHCSYKKSYGVFTGFVSGFFAIPTLFLNGYSTEFVQDSFRYLDGYPVVDTDLQSFYLTISLRARVFYERIVNEGWTAESTIARKKR
ncbi:uncharacterized protein LOC144651146 [Oculina patagonica]